MTERQKKVLVDAFVLLGAGARAGKRKLESGEGAHAVRAHVAEMKRLVEELERGIDEHVGATAVLARAKTLSSSKRVMP